jgi:hypothetical protein
MEGKKFIIRVLATTMIGAGFLLVTGVAWCEHKYAPRVPEYWVEFPGGGKVRLVIDPQTGCIGKVFDAKGNPISAKNPNWLKEGKEVVYFGSLTDSQCQQGVIAIQGSPIEYWIRVGGYYVCIGAYDPACGRWYQPCNGPYLPRCP